MSERSKEHASKACEEQSSESSNLSFTADKGGTLVNNPRSRLLFYLITAFFLSCVVLLNFWEGNTSHQCHNAEDDHRYRCESNKHDRRADGGEDHDDAGQNRDDPREDGPS